MIAQLGDSEWFVEELSKMYQIKGVENFPDINMNFFIVDDIFSSKKREISEITYEIEIDAVDKDIRLFLVENGYNFKRDTDMRNGKRSISYMKERFI